MGSPPLIYLDSQDYSRFGDVLLGKADTETERVYAELLKRQQAGEALFAYSMPILGELLQFDEEYAETTESKALAVEQLCGGNALIFPGRLVALEVAALLQGNESIPPSLSNACSREDYWYPDVSESFSDFRKTMRAYLDTELNAPKFGNRSSRRGLRKRAKKLDLARFVESAAPEMAEAYQIPLETVTSSIVELLRGRITPSQASHRFFSVIARPTAFVDVYFKRYRGEKTFPEWVGDMGRGLQDRLIHLRKSFAPFVNNKDYNKSLRRTLAERTPGLGATILGLAELSLGEFGIGRASFESLRGNLMQALRVPACEKTGKLMQAYVLQTSGLRGNPAVVERSFGGDMVHALYADHVDLWRGDRRFSDLFRRAVPRLESKIIARLTMLPAAIDAFNAAAP
jgi:hypothetical protein